MDHFPLIRQAITKIEIYAPTLRKITGIDELTDLHKQMLRNKAFVWNSRDSTTNFP